MRQTDPIETDPNSHRYDTTKFWYGKLCVSIISVQTLIQAPQSYDSYDMSPKLGFPTVDLASHSYRSRQNRFGAVILGCPLHRTPIQCWSIIPILPHGHSPYDPSSSRIFTVILLVADVKKVKSNIFLVFIFYKASLTFYNGVTTSSKKG